MATKEVFAIDQDELRKMNRAARRKALASSQGKTRERVEKNRKKYTRKLKHKGLIDAGF